MADVIVTVTQATPVNVTVAGQTANATLGQVLPVYQQKEVYVPQSFTATQGQTTFALSSLPRENSVQAFRNGVAYGADEFTVVGTNLVLNGGANAGDIIDTRFVVA